MKSWSKTTIDHIIWSNLNLTFSKIPSNTRTFWNIDNETNKIQKKNDTLDSIARMKNVSLMSTTRSTYLRVSKLISQVFKISCWTKTQTRIERQCIFAWKIIEQSKLNDWIKYQNHKFWKNEDFEQNLKKIQKQLTFEWKTLTKKEFSTFEEIEKLKF